MDNHDEAMAWARNRVFEINPVTGALQIINVSQAEQVVPPKTDKKKTVRLVEQVRGRSAALLRPPCHLAARSSGRAHPRRTPRREQAPARRMRRGPDVAGRGHSAGRNPCSGRAQPKKEKVDTGDLAAALEHPDTRRRFVTILSDKDLTAILDAPLEKWRVFLHPSQEKLVAKNFNGPAKVTGGAGTGKTVVAMHRAKHLASKVFPEKTDRILFTTFTANLAQNVEQMLSTALPGVHGSPRSRPPARLGRAVPAETRV